jgi:hypothetical protein
MRTPDSAATERAPIRRSTGTWPKLTHPLEPTRMKNSTRASRYCGWANIPSIGPWEW